MTAPQARGQQPGPSSLRAETPDGAPAAPPATPARPYRQWLEPVSIRHPNQPGGTIRPSNSRSALTQGANDDSNGHAARAAQISGATGATQNPHHMPKSQPGRPPAVAHTAAAESFT
ncbi:hypothetical protein FRC12_004367 [Ceratobasidium sp. 428]|nr:hypothetical protein FRC12_004367 [Ceratobasidium sp. 428]